jgi:hypothetical protein
MSPATTDTDRPTPPDPVSPATDGEDDHDAAGSSPRTRPHDARDGLWSAGRVEPHGTTRRGAAPR